MRDNCTHCEHLGKDCPKKLMLLPLAELISWCVHVLERCRLTHEDLARLSQVPKGTIDRVLAGQSADCKYSTIRAIVCALMAYIGSVPVCLEDVRLAEVEHDTTLTQRALTLEREAQDLRGGVDALTQHKNLLVSELEQRTAYLQHALQTVKELRRAIWVMAVLLVLLIVILIAMLIVDRLDPTVGFFWIK